MKNDRSLFENDSSSSELYINSMTLFLKVMQPFVYGYSSSSIVEAHFVYDQLIYYIYNL